MKTLTDHWHDTWRINVYKSHYFLERGEFFESGIYQRLAKIANAEYLMSLVTTNHNRENPNAR